MGSHYLTHYFFLGWTQIHFQNKNKIKAFCDLGGAKDMMAPFLGFWGHGRVAPPPRIRQCGQQVLPPPRPPAARWDANEPRDYREANLLINAM